LCRTYVLVTDQQSAVGRARPALEEAQTLLVPADSDERIWDYLATSGIPDEQQVERILDALGDTVLGSSGAGVLIPQTGGIG
jgi:hypothetical protein